MIKVIITGSSGMVGRGVLLECLDSPFVSDILLVSRSPIDINHLKIKELLVKDFFDLKAIEQKLQGYDACFFCLGTTAMGKTEEEYYKTTYELTLHFAKTILKHNPGMSICYVSGAGTSSSEKSRMMWARVKGKTENDLLQLPFKAAYMFRPGFIEPLRGIKTKTKLYQFFIVLLKPLLPVFRLFPNAVTDTTKVGKAMINAVMRGNNKKHLETRDINRLADKVPY
jgi:uncharacterized protein YbjT (DUF2867 family)